jgi:hypothetical protein
MACRICKIDGIVPDVRVAIEIGGIVWIRYNRVRLAPPVKINVIPASAVEIETL